MPATNKKPTNPKLLELLVCPITHKTLTYDRKNQQLISKTIGLAFPIRDGVPIMIESEAFKIKTDKF